jgi:type IV pilus assembly protein PilW
MDRGISFQLLSRRGFTLIEILVAMALTGIVVGAIYTTYKSQQDTYMAQDQVAEMQLNLRAAAHIVASDIRMAGYNPKGIPDLAGFVTTLPCNPAGPSDDLPVAPGPTQIAFTVDSNGDGILDNTDAEQIAYRLNAASQTLERFRPSSRAWAPVAADIEALDLVYLDGSGAPITGALAANLTRVRLVEITLLARAMKRDRNFRNTQTYTNQQGTPIFTAPGDNYRRRLLTTTVLCRNMGS